MLMEQIDSNKFLQGQIILIDKPLTWTSFDVVKKLKWLIRKEYNLKKIKIGHAGTLDPLATGLLVVCTGKFTKKINEIQRLIKGSKQTNVYKFLDKHRKEEIKDLGLKE